MVRRRLQWYIHEEVYRGEVLEKKEEEGRMERIERRNRILF